MYQQQTRRYSNDQYHRQATSNQALASQRYSADHGFRGGVPEQQQQYEHHGGGGAGRHDTGGYYAEPAYDEGDYEERDLGDLACDNQAEQERAWRHGPEAGVPWQDPATMFAAELPTSPVGVGGRRSGGGAGPGGRFSAPPPPRSSYSSPSAGPRPNSFEVGSVYSAPSAYGYYDPPPEDYYYGGGTGGPAPRPGSVASSNRTLAITPRRSFGGPLNERRSVGGPPSLYGASAAPDDDGLFGVAAPHHRPGARGGPPPGAGGPGDYLPNFPAWSRTWYDGHLSANGHAYTSVPPPSGAQSGWESETLTHSARSGRAGGPPYGLYGRAAGEEGVTDFVKEERMRMLEKEFGPKVKHRGADGDDDDEEDDTEEDEDANLTPGSVDSKGRIVSARPGIRTAIRWCQGLLSILALALGVGGALMVKPTVKAPAAGKLPAFLLYGVSAISTLILLYLFVFRPCCCDPLRKRNGHGPDDSPLSGLVVPVLTGGMPNKKGKFGKGRKGRMMQGGATTVNLIVDPTMLGGGGGKRGKGGDDASSDEEEMLPGEGRSRGPGRKRGRRKGAIGSMGVMGNMRQQARKLAARKFVKVLIAWDVVLSILWLATAVVCIAMGKKCPIGSSQGWCDLYNSAIACGVLVAVASMHAIYFGAVDLKASKRDSR